MAKFKIYMVQYKIVEIEAKTGEKASDEACKKYPDWEYEDWEEMEE